MRFSLTSAAALAQVFVSLALAEANPAPAPASPSQTSAALNQVNSYLDALATGPAFSVLSSVLATNSQASSLGNLIYSDIVGGQLSAIPTAASAWPTPLVQFVSSVVSVASSIETANGITANAAKPTGMVGAAAGAAAGMVGVMMAL